MKIAIHKGKSWNIRWSQYCKENSINFINVDCYDSDIIQVLKKNEITHLMWHFQHSIPKDILMARNVLYSAKFAGIKTFPSFNTCWHFDDKISQKYLLEAVGAKIVPTYVFYNKKDALIWLQNKAKFPIVAKLRRGAGSYNVKLIKNLYQAKKYTKRMFGSGMNPRPGYLADTKNKLRVAGSYKGIINKLKKAPGFFKMVKRGGVFPKEKGYVHFQDFIPNNEFDIRVAVVGNHIWSFKRKTRKGDFRASGSGSIYYDIDDIPLKIIKILFELSKLLNTQSIAYDLVKDKLENYYIVEISYGYDGEAIYNTYGYWDENLNFIEGHFWPEYIILEDFIK